MNFLAKINFNESHHFLVCFILFSTLESSKKLSIFLSFIKKCDLKNQLNFLSNVLLYQQARLFEND